MDTARISTTASDDALMVRMRAGDVDVLREVAALYGPLPFRIACRMLGDPVEAEDIAQEALVRLWQFSGNWKDGHAIPAWLRRVATNLCLDRLRQTRRISGSEIPDQEDDAPLADRAIEADQLRAAVVECIGELPDRQRAAIILTYYEQQSNQSVAEVLAMGLKAFESMLMRARQHLQGCVEGKGVMRADVAGMA